VLVSWNIYQASRVARVKLVVTIIPTTTFVKCGYPAVYKLHPISMGDGNLAHRDIVVIGTSAGGLEALQSLFSRLPDDLNAAVLVVMHRTENTASLLPEILARSATLPVISPEDGDLIRRGQIYIGPPGVHMLVENGRVRLIRGPRENRHRPAIDPLFRSAAASFGPRVIGVILTGMLDDGTSGVMVICAHGGSAVIQSPKTAMFPAMPQNALNRVPDAVVAPIEEIPSVLHDMIAENIEVNGYGRPIEEDVAERETKAAEVDMGQMENENRLEEASEFGCPECGGVLWEIEQGDLLRFRCRVGHAYTADHLQAAQRQAVESALWAALRALEENLSMYKRLAGRAVAAGNRETARTYEERISTTEANARVLQRFLLNVNANPENAIEAAEELA
jgi:two-component system, chemotaxis family, protein-glutamate methylesterase/glutaminase